MSKKILIVEDEEGLAELAKVRLEANGYEVEVALDGEEGVAKIFSYKPDLVVLDLMMPKKDGMQVLEEIRRPDTDFAKMPIIIMSARTDTDTMLDVEKLGATDYIIKSDEPEKLLEIIRVYLK